MSAVNKHGQLYGLGPANVHKRIQGGSGSPACIKDVVYHDDDFALKRKIYLRPVYNGLIRQSGKIVPVKSYVQKADRRFHAFDFLYFPGYAASQGRSPAPDANQGDVA
jgi:hypothetical protein